MTVWLGECSWEYTPPNSLTRQKNYRGPETLGMSGTTLGSRNFQGLETHDMQSMFASTGLQKKPSGIFEMSPTMMNVEI